MIDNIGITIENSKAFHSYYRARIARLDDSRYLKGNIQSFTSSLSDNEFEYPCYPRPIEMSLSYMMDYEMPSWLPSTTIWNRIDIWCSTLMYYVYYFLLPSWRVVEISWMHLIWKCAMCILWYFKIASLPCWSVSESFKITTACKLVNSIGQQTDLIWS